MKVIYNKKEEGTFGVEAAILIAAFIVSLIIVLTVNRAIAGLGWKGFITYMQPNYLYPSFSGGFSSNTGKNVLLAAIYLQQNIVMRYFVNALFFLILLFTGLAYIYSDLFEQYFGKLKTLLPRIIFGLILAYSSLYIVEGLMVIAKAGYIIFYDTPGFTAWRHEDYLFRVCPEIRLFSPNSGFASLNQLVSIYWQYLWVFIIMVEALSLLVFVAFRMVLLAMLIVLLPIASILLIHPWTQNIGSRLWWLAIDLIFLPIVMIIPLMLSTVVGNSVSFFIAALTAVLGSIYLLAKEPFLLGGLGFQRAGNLLTGGVVGGGMSGNLLAPSRIGTGVMSQSLSGLSGGAMKSLSAGISSKIANMRQSRVQVPTVEGGGGTAGGGAESGAGVPNNMPKWASSRGGVED